MERDNVVAFPTKQPRQAVDFDRLEVTLRLRNYAKLCRVAELFDTTPRAVMERLIERHLEACEL